MYNLTDLYKQAVNTQPIHIKKQYGETVIDSGFKLQVFPSKTEILNCSKKWRLLSRNKPRRI